MDQTSKWGLFDSWFAYRQANVDEGYYIACKMIEHCDDPSVAAKQIFVNTDLGSSDCDRIAGVVVEWSSDRRRSFIALAEGTS